MLNFSNFKFNYQWRNKINQVQSRKNSFEFKDFNVLDNSNLFT